MWADITHIPSKEDAQHGTYIFVAVSANVYKDLGMCFIMYKYINL